MAEPMPPPPPETFTARLVQARALTPRVRELTWARVDGQPFRFEAGQWVNLVLPLVDEHGRPLRRAYSVASAPNDTPRFELAVTRVEHGPASCFLHAAQPGLCLEVKGPLGTFTRPLATAAPSLFVATGTGIAPFRAMVHAAVAAGRAEPLWVLMGVRSLEEALYLEEFQRLSALHPCVRVEVTLSRPQQGWRGRTGYVQDHVVELWTELSARGVAPHAYVCGLKKMLLQVREVLRVQLGVDRKHVHAEAYD